jgi:hypothetical protein
VTVLRPGRSGTVAWKVEPRVDTVAPELWPLTESVTSVHLAEPLTRSDQAKASPPRIVKPMTGFTDAEADAPDLDADPAVEGVAFRRGPPLQAPAISATAASVASAAGTPRGPGAIALALHPR